jgi:hypothetical protein
MDEEVVVDCFKVRLLLRNSRRSEETHTKSQTALQRMRTQATELDNAASGPTDG